MLSRLLVIIATFCLISAAVRDYTLSTRARSSVKYDDIRLGKKLVGSLIQTHAFQSHRGCALACNQNNRCLSYNFCGRQICQLNSEDVFSTKCGEQILQDDQRCRPGCSNVILDISLFLKILCS